jgi:hypothetical protein
VALDKVLASIVALTLLIIFFCGCVVLYVGVTQWFLAQNEAIYISDSMAMYGGYTDVLNQQVINYCSNYKIDFASVNLNVTPSVPGSTDTPPAAYGQEVDVVLSYKYPMSFMGVTFIPMTITTHASAVCTYVQGIAPGGNLISVQYIAAPSV